MTTKGVSPPMEARLARFEVALFGEFLPRSGRRKERDETLKVAQLQNAQARESDASVSHAVSITLGSSN